MTAPKPAPAPKCEGCRIDLLVERKGQFVALYVCPKCGVAVMDPPKSPSAS